MEKVSVSIIVPVYNAEKYLAQCLDSLRNQTLNSIEILLINDGSTDSSANIIREYAEKDPRFHVLTQTNAGLASARNTGMQAAKGEYIGFVDSDDWVLPEMFASLYRKAIHEKADIVQCAHLFCCTAKNVSLKYDNSSQMDLLTRSNGKLTGAEEILLADASVWNRIYQRELLEKHHVSFPKDIRFGEEIYFYFITSAIAEKIAILPDAFYMYRKDNPKSLTADGGSHRFSSFRVFRLLDDFFSEEKYRSIRPYLNHVKLSYCCFAYQNLPAAMKRQFLREFLLMLQNVPFSKKEIAYPVNTKGVMQKARYGILKQLHPMTIFSIEHQNQFFFDQIIRLRTFLSAIPLTAALLLHKKRSPENA